MNSFDLSTNPSAGCFCHAASSAVICQSEQSCLDIPTLSEATIKNMSLQNQYYERTIPKSRTHENFIKSYKSPTNFKTLLNANLCRVYDHSPTFYVTLVALHKVTFFQTNISDVSEVPLLMEPLLDAEECSSNKTGHPQTPNGSLTWLREQFQKELDRQEMWRWVGTILTWLNHLQIFICEGISRITCTTTTLKQLANWRQQSQHKSRKASKRDSSFE